MGGLVFFSGGSLFDCGVLGIDGGRYGIQYKYHELLSQNCIFSHIRIASAVESTLRHLSSTPVFSFHPPAHTKKKKTPKEIPEHDKLNRNPLSSNEALLPRGEKRKKEGQLVHSRIFFFSRCRVNRRRILIVIGLSICFWIERRDKRWLCIFSEYDVVYGE